MLSPFSQRIADIILSVPSGKVATYGQVAFLAGNPRAARQVARLLHSCSLTLGLPWHRIISSQGCISLPYPFCLEQKELLLREGVRFDHRGKIDLKRFGLTPKAHEAMIHPMENNNRISSDQLLERFLRYVKIPTTSDMHIAEIPSTPRQWDLLNLLTRELKDFGLGDVELNKNGYLIARLPSTIPGEKQPPVIGFMAHVDTASDLNGENINPRVIPSYNGGRVELGSGYSLDPLEFPELLRYKGQTIITTDGTTLLGADDKAGIAEIMEAVSWLVKHPEVPHGEVEIIFTPDEETGKGMDLFPRDNLRSVYCYTMDGGEEGEVEAECFNAFKADIRFTGKVIHLGKARGKLVNAVTMAGTFISLLPANESPEATDERYGYYCPLEVKGGLDEAHLLVFLRDFELSEIDRRIGVLEKTALAVEALFEGGKVEITSSKQYLNMREHMARRPEGMILLEKAIRQAGVEPISHIIRGGTDGSRLSEMGIPTPNVFTGGHNYHSRFEWAGLPAMVKAGETIINLIGLWGGESF